MGRSKVYLGIDIGAVSINAIAMDDNYNILYEHPYIRHFGKTEEKCAQVLEKLFQIFDRQGIVSVSFTGNHGRKIAEYTQAFFEFESIAQLIGALKIVPDARTIISMGGQDTALFQISHYEDGSWELEYFKTNGPCASGTGSFIDQQAQRLSISMYESSTNKNIDEIDAVLKDFIELGLRSKNPSNVACRCTVFTKSDMIHLQNKGEKLEDIIYGLHLGNARNYISTIVGNRELRDPIIFIGGLSLNELQVRAFREYFKDLRIPKFCTSLGALGVAVMAKDRNDGRVVRPADIKAVGSGQGQDLPVGERLGLNKTVFNESRPVAPRLVRPLREPLYLGVDIGSTTTKYVLMDQHRQIVDKRYVATRGKPIEVMKELLQGIEEKFQQGLNIVGVSTTGSGRHVVGDFLNADVMVDEITAHARGAVEIDPEVDTVFEIGGQDSKYIFIRNKNPMDFDMNKVCAAGTGSFLHELASKYGVNIVGEFQEVALSSMAPIRLAERCTVFMESDLVSYHQRGAKREDLLGGLCYAIVHNYLNRVVGKRKVGKRVMFLGGPSLNKAVVAAFEKVLDRPLIVPPHREVLGAYGAALVVQEHMSQKRSSGTRFRGIRSAIEDNLSFEEKVCRADPACHNQCKLRVYDFDGRKSIWGGECGRYDVTRGVGLKVENHFASRQRLMEAYLKELLGDSEANSGPTIGLSRALFMHQTLLFWAKFFKELRFNVVLTPQTTNQIADRGIELTLAETCFPVKVSHGHYDLLNEGVDYIFAPHMIDMPTLTGKEMGFYCPMVQSNSFMVKAAIGLKNTISPVVRLKQDDLGLSHALFEELKRYFKIRAKDVLLAVRKAREYHNGFREELLKMGREILEGHDPQVPLIVVTGRPYNLYDERLNLRLGQNLAKIGMRAVTMDFLDVSQVDLSDFPSMYWGLGSQILRTAKVIKETPYIFGIHLTNFGCGPDSFLEHFYRHVMGEKPYLILELDEHSAVAGMMTRLEAFKNVVENSMMARQEYLPATKGLFS